MHNTMETTPEQNCERITFDFSEKEPAMTDPANYNRFLYKDEILRIRDMANTCLSVYEKQNLTDEYIRELNDYKLQKKNDEDYFKYYHSGRTFDGFLYLFLDRENKKLKIGRSTNPSRRLKQLQHEFSTSLESLFELENSASLEEYILWFFRKYNLHGEWFSYQKEIIDYFDDLQYAQEFEREYNEYLEYIGDEQ